MSAFRNLQKWVDRELRAAKAGGERILLFIPLLAPLLFASFVGNGSHTVWIVCGAISSAWLIYVMSRVWVMCVASAAKADKKYDDVTRFQLSKEYHDTHSGSGKGRFRK